MTGRSQEEMAWLGRLHAHLQEHARDVGAVLDGGRVAVVVFEPAQTKLMRKALLRFGARKRTVFPMAADMERRLRRADHITARWLDRKDVGRVFVMSGEGSLLVCVDKDGLSIEPDSTDASATRWMS